ncbi:MAG: pyruvate dehydrogenase (acetyl-transferring) E1 component subunit alpha [Chloroflexi bacterium RBG_16_54_18]|nr:MAG: pyruvate dehydrogenase (acetyl-transferring) E1 component subunit alpha [Chloroflexi bacterium RBG_16_54_18]
MALTKEQLVSLLGKMLLIRYCEEQVVKSYARGEIPGGVHTYIGEEAVATGVCAHLRPEDAVFSTHRGHGHALAKGMKPERLIAEVMGKATGCCGGRGGSMHLFEPSVGFYGSSGIVGPSILLASGAAYAAILANAVRVGVAFFGDGASNTGAFHEGINMATAWGLPVIYVCENNMYATEVPFAKISKIPSIASRALAYGLPGVEVDGNDVLAVYQAAGEAVTRARAGNGPTLIECHTYRVRAHSEGMRDTGYRTQEEVESWKVRDPILLFKTRLLAQGMIAQAEIDGLEAEIRKTAEAAADFARKSPLPDPATVTDYLYS